ncbi:hypothetical protein [Bacteriophage Phobos]|uniref:DUF2815 family protein n=1 Tax=Bacteriophage Phobos TaxID=2662138 RepID=A0A5Q2UBR7_9CAUD|nr:hypothetical protein JT319_gp12 [Bacteriophage Phobos]QGH44981.1 hypothetical protein [Bacteriophage Phobos]WPK42377.1 hypothetical protein [Pseudomonas phage Ppu-503]
MAEAKKKRLGTIALKLVRLSFPKLFTPESSTEDGPKKYSAGFLIDPSTPEGKANIKALEAERDRIATELWGDKADKILAKLDADRSLLRDGDDATNQEGDVYDGYEDMMYITASNKRKPQTLDRDKTPVDDEDDILYGGCYVDAIVSVWGTTKKELGGNGIFATLELVRKRREGDRFGAAPVDVDDYLDDLDDEDEEDGLI